MEICAAVERNYEAACKITWKEATDFVKATLKHSVANKTVTYDFVGPMEGAGLIERSKFGTEIIANT